jgi:hypothetical protein
MESEALHPVRLKQLVKQLYLGLALDHRYDPAVIVFQRAWIIVGFMLGLYLFTVLSVAAVLIW